MDFINKKVFIQNKYEYDKAIQDPRTSALRASMGNVLYILKYIMFSASLSVYLPK